MTSQFVLTFGREALTLLLMIAMPVLGVVMGVGLLVSIFQVHEATLAFVPKLLAAVLVFAVAGPWMLSTLVDFIRRTIEGIPGAIG